MAVFLLDSTVLIDYLRGHPEVIARVGALAEEGHDLGICAINVVEAFAGMLEHEREATERLLSWLELLDISFETARRAGQLQSELRRQGRKADTADTLIGTVALVNGATLLTANVKDFPLPGLQVERLPSGR